MNSQNTLSIQIPDTDLKAVRDALATIQSTLSPYLLALTPEERRTFPKMGDGSEPFVSKVMDYAASDPQFVPPFVDVLEMQDDWEASKDLIPLLRSISQLQSNLNDTVLLAGSECYVAALSYYKSVKMAAKMNVAGAKVIFDDLSKRFEGQGKVKTDPVV